MTHAWPREYGGGGWSPMQRYIYESEASLCGAPAVAPMGINLVGPVICEFGSPWQKEFYLPRIRSGEDYWCQGRSEEHTSELQSLMRISYAVFCLKKKKKKQQKNSNNQ